jgi:hypothetical protein
LASPVDGIRLYPMFSGTDLSVMSIPNSSKTETIRVPMSSLSAAEMEKAVVALSMGRQTPFILFRWCCPLGDTVH